MWVRGKLVFGPRFILACLSKMWVREKLVFHPRFVGQGKVWVRGKLPSVGGTHCLNLYIDLYYKGQTQKAFRRLFYGCDKRRRLKSV